jgi:hypothetical protein
MFDALNASFTRARAGQRQLTVVLGEAGIGKTTLLTSFADQLRAPCSNLVTGGSCTEDWGAREPYRPLLEAIARLCRLRGEHVALLRQNAPSWLLQLPALHDPSEVPGLERRTAGITHQRMAREISDYLEALAGRAPLVLWIEDLQWADTSTLDWLVAFMARSDPARVHVIVTLRAEERTRAHEICAAARLKPWCSRLVLDGLDEAATRQLVESHRPELASRIEIIAARLHAVTEGHPLFITTLLEDEPLEWTEGDAAAVSRVTGESPGVPERLRDLIEVQIGRLAHGDVQLLEVASLLAEHEWSAALVAAGSDELPHHVEDRLMRLTQTTAFVRHVGSTAWPDGTVSERFSFRHAIHRSVLSARLSAGRRAEAHRRLGRRLEQAFGADVRRFALPLAHHFEQSGEIKDAVDYLAEAARAANRMGATVEAQHHITRGLALLGQIAPSEDRDARECVLQIVLGGILMAARGWGAPEAAQAYEQARALCDRSDTGEQRFTAYWGLWLFRWGRGELQQAEGLADTLERLAEDSRDLVQRLQVHHARWATAFCLGRLQETLRHTHRVRTSSAVELAGPAALSYGNHHAGVCALSFEGRALAAAGRSHDARRAADEGVAEARRFDHPFSLALALLFSAATHHLLRDRRAVAVRAAEAKAIAADFGFGLLRAWAVVLAGWAVDDPHDRNHAVGLMADAVAAAHASGSGQFRAYLLGTLADAMMEAGDARSASAALDDAFDWVHQTGEAFYEAELHRLHGELMTRDPAAHESAARTSTVPADVGRADGSPNHTCSRTRQSRRPARSRPERGTRAVVGLVAIGSLGREHATTEDITLVERQFFRRR